MTGRSGFVRSRAADRRLGFEDSATFRESEDSIAEIKSKFVDRIGFSESLKIFHVF
jgi:RimJ/RimL family protein N-acetyltransferase